MAKSTDTKSAFFLKDCKDTNFDDSGTERRFAEKDVVDLPLGIYANYEAAGIVRPATADDKKVAAAS